MDTEGDGEPLDLLDTRKTREVLRGPKSQPAKHDSDDDMEYTSEGKLIVDESGDRIREKLKRKKQWEEDHPDAVSQGGKSSKHKRSENTESRERSVSKAGPAKKLKKENSSWAYTGDEYASKKSKVMGDVKKEGKLDPYAYWPLDPKILNRRETKRTAARKGLGSVMHTTKKMQGMSSRDALATKGANRNKQQKAHKDKSKAQKVRS